VINKADRPGVESTERALKTMLELAHPVRKVFRHHGQVVELNGDDAPDARLWIPPVQRAVATEGKGILELLEAVERHVAHLRSSGDWVRRERARLEAEFDLLLQETLVARFLSQIHPKSIDSTLESIQNREISPREAIERLLNENKI
jgi:LAO/AO transport system kinase